MVIGAWRRRRDALFGPFLGYAVLLFAFSAIVSAVHVPGGTFIHSAVALAPHGYVLALEGIVAGGGLARRADARAGTRRRPRGCSSAGRSRSGCSPPSSARARCTGAGTPSARTCRPWRPRSTTPGAPVTDRVMSIDAAGVPVLDRPPGRGAGQRPARHRRAGRARVRDPLARPRAPRTASRRRAQILVDAPAAVLGRAAGPRGRRRLVYPVCLDAGDPRCPTRSRARAGEPARGVDHGARACSRSRSRCASWPPRSSPSRSPRTRPTTSASRATSSRAAASCRTRCGATARRRSCSRGPRSRSGCRCRRCSRPSRWPWRAGRADPARDGDARAQVVSVVAGALVAVLAWRLAADVAAGARPAGRAGPGRSQPGHGAHGGGVPAAAAPLLAARLHDAVRRPRPRRGLLMTRVLRDPRGGPGAGPAARSGSACSSASRRSPATRPSGSP